MRRLLLALAALAATPAASVGSAQMGVPVPPPGPAFAAPAMPGTIVAGLAAAPSLSAYRAAVHQAGFDATLAGNGPFTVFAPTNAAFGRLAPGSVELLMRPENKPTLAKLLGYLVVPGQFTVADLKARIAAGGGTTTLPSLEGEPITLTVRDNAMLLTDRYGNRSYVETPDAAESNGVVHQINGVLLPKLG